MSQVSSPAASWQKSGLKLGHQVLGAWLPDMDQATFPVWETTCQVRRFGRWGLVCPKVKRNQKQRSRRGTHLMSA